MRLHLHTALAAGIAFALGAAADPARADAGIGPAPGNALNPAPVNPTTQGRWMDEDGLGTRIPAARTPSGQLYNMPLNPGEEADVAKDGRWKTSGFIELGPTHVFGDERSPGTRNYKDLRNGMYLNNFGFIAEKPDDACYVEAVGGAAGMDDQFYRLTFGRYNAWKVSAFYDETPQLFTTAYRSLWNGVGSGNLTLATLRPGGTTSAAVTQTNIQNALAATGNSDLEAIRKKAGVRFDMNVSESWKIYASLVNEKREGARPFGMVFGGGGGGGNFETAESIDYTTHDLVAGLSYSDPVQSFNLRASASFFRNDLDTMTVQNPLFVTLNGTSGLAPTLFTQGRIDLPPNNEHFNVKGEYARALPDFFRGNLTATLALGSMRQNDDLIAPTEYPLTGGTVTAGGASLANVWNTTSALQRQSAQARIDTRLADVGLSLRPTNALDVKGKLRYYETRNTMQYQACNPLTGQWGRLLNDGSGLSLVTANTTAGANPAGTSANAYNAFGCDLGAVQAAGLVPSTGNAPIASVPYDYQQLNGSVTADYRLGRASSVNGALERESFRRDFRERDETWEDKIKVGYVDRGMLEGMIRVSYEYARRRGGEYDSNPYEPFYSASFGPTPAADTVAMQTWLHSIAQFASFDLADRNQNVLNGRVNYAFHQNLDGALTVQLKDAEFPGQYGRTGHQRTNSATVDLSYQSGSTSVIYGFYSYQAGTLDQKGVHPNSCILGSTYYFYSNGQVLDARTGAAAPATPAGATLLSTQNVVAGNWQALCGSASPTSPLFPESRAWDVGSKDNSNVLGAGIKYDFGKVQLDTSFTRALGRTRISYTYNPAALGMSAVQASLAGSGMSDLTFAQNVLSASLFVPLKKDVVMRVLVRHETGKIRDWHYDGVAANPMPANNAAYLDSGPQDYRSTLLGVLFQIRM